MCVSLHGLMLEDYVSVPEHESISWYGVGFVFVTFFFRFCVLKLDAVTTAQNRHIFVC